MKCMNNLFSVAFISAQNKHYVERTWLSQLHPKFSIEVKDKKQAPVLVVE